MVWNKCNWGKMTIFVLSSDFFPTSAEDDVRAATLELKWCFELRRWTFAFSLSALAADSLASMRVTDRQSSAGGCSSAGACHWWGPSWRRGPPSPGRAPGACGAGRAPWRRRRRQQTAPFLPARSWSPSLSAPDLQRHRKEERYYMGDTSCAVTRLARSQPAQVGGWVSHSYPWSSTISGGGGGGIWNTALIILSATSRDQEKKK